MHRPPPKPLHKIAFVSAATDHGTLIVNRYDWNRAADYYGVGHMLLEAGSYEAEEIAMTLGLLDLRHEFHGDDVVAIDCGANIGVHTVEWSRHMIGWGSVLAVEAQERIYYALAGNIALNNCFNARAIHAAAAAESGLMKMPVPNYLEHASFGSLELRDNGNTEFIGQAIDYSDAGMTSIRTISLDSLKLPRVDLIKIDVEGMEFEVLRGGAECIAQHHPILLVEANKTGRTELRAWLSDRGYSTFNRGINLMAIHQSDKCLASIRVSKWAAARAAQSGET